MNLEPVIYASDKLFLACGQTPLVPGSDKKKFEKLLRKSKKAAPEPPSEIKTGISILASCSNARRSTASSCSFLAHVMVAMEMSFLFITQSGFLTILRKQYYVKPVKD